MSVYSVRGFTAATTTTADHVIAQLWNQSTAKKIKVVEIGLFKAGAGAANDSLYIGRSTTRGTAGSTVTPDIDNDWAHELSPVSTALLDLAAFSAQPTVAGAPYLFGWVAANVAASGFVWPCPRGIWIKQSNGLVIAQRAATAWPTSEVYFEWEE